MRTRVTNVIQRRAATAGCVSPGARRVRTVAMMLIAAATDPMPRTSEREDPVVGAGRRENGVSLSGA